MRRSAERNYDYPMAFVRAGWNKILIKATQITGGWGFHFRFYDPENSLRYALRPGS